MRLKLRKKNSLFIRSNTAGCLLTGPVAEIDGLAIFFLALLAALPVDAEKPAPQPPTKKSSSSAITPNPMATEPGVGSGTLLTRVFEERATQILERYIPVRDFQVTVRVTPSGKTLPKAPYDPKGLSTGTLSSLEAEELDTYVKQVKIDVLLNERLASTRPKLQALLTKSLNLQPQRGDRITFGNLGIEVAPDEWVKEKSDMKMQIERIKAENEKLNRELTQAQSAARDATRDAETAKEQALDAKSKSSNTGDRDSGFWKDFWQKNAKLIWISALVAGILCSIALFALFIFGRSFANTGKNLSLRFDDDKSECRNRRRIARLGRPVARRKREPKLTRGENDLRRRWARLTGPSAEWPRWHSIPLLNI